MNQAGYLFRLQRVDSQLDHIRARIIEIDRLLEEDSRLIAAKKEHEDAKHALEAARQNLRNIEHFVSEQHVKIEQNESTLYSGVVKNPKELQDLQLELASLKKHLAKLEDRQLDAMIQNESAESVESEFQARLHAVQAEIIQEKAGLAGERKQMSSKHDSLEIERTAILPPITASNLGIYQRIRDQKNGIAVTEVEDDACVTCGAPVRPAEAQSARLHQQLFYCTSCGRILFAG